MPDFAAGALQAHHHRVGADSEYGRDLREAVSLNFFQQKHIPVSLGQFEGSEYQALESSGAFQSGHRLPDV